jgi:hypothetical protein
MSQNTGTALAVNGDDPFASLRTKALEIGMLIFPQMDQIDFTGPFAVLSRIPNCVCGFSNCYACIAICRPSRAVGSIELSAPRRWKTRHQRTLKPHLYDVSVLPCRSCDGAALGEK